MYFRSVIIAMLAVSLGSGVDARGRNDEAKRGGPSSGGASRGSSWFGLRPGGGQPSGPSAGPSMSYPQGYQAPTSGRQGNAPIYPGLPDTVRRSPRMSEPSGPTSSGFVPPSSGSSAPRFGETRPAYEARIGRGAASGPSGDDAPPSAVPYGGGSKSYYPPQIEQSAPRTPSSRLALPRSSGSPTMQRAESNPALDRMMEQYEGKVAPGGRSSSVPVDFSQAQQRLQQAMERGDYDTINRETQALSRQVEIMRQGNAGQDTNQKIEALNVAPMAQEAVDQLREGSKSRSKGKVQAAIKKLGEATERSRGSKR